MKKHGYEVYPVNSDLKELEGETYYASLTDIPVKVDVVDFVVPPNVTEEMLKECQELGLDRVWLQPGSESETAIAFCSEHNLKVVHSICVMLSKEKLNNDIVVILKPDKSLLHQNLE